MELFKRTIFGGLYVALVLGALLLGSSALYLMVFMFLAFVGVCEYAALVGINRTRPLRTILDGLAAAYLFFAVYSFATTHEYHMLGGAIFAPYLFYIGYIMVRAIYSDRDFMPNEIAKVFFGQIYVGGGLAVGSLLADTSASFAPERLLLIAFVGIWVNDTGAFIVGSSIGKHRLFPSVSPKKSWEGFMGGLLATVLVTISLAGYWFDDIYQLWQSALIGVVISAAATWGDLFESMLKRNAGVKDSGKIIPGHGGVLDRIDSVLFVLPALLILTLILHL
ncbi:MAG: phosphatidate cytidylyltransferase [Porphyromonadaceae bacterium]|nr:phosphatidate cytidylyltransferase [Porphyromonadaceae bacterium]